MEWLGAAALVAVILAVVATVPIAAPVTTGLRCEVGRIFGSASGEVACPEPMPRT